MKAKQKSDIVVTPCEEFRFIKEHLVAKKKVWSVNCVHGTVMVCRGVSIYGIYIVNAWDTGEVTSIRSDEGITVSYENGTLLIRNNKGINLDVYATVC